MCAVGGKKTGEHVRGTCGAGVGSLRGLDPLQQRGSCYVLPRVHAERMGQASGLTGIQETLTYKPSTCRV